ncbi:hypothetical protein DPMN_079942 [Dreissena polymorpha]|uniref:Uncharacterized protein n=1 Tax=Dreissena polymorpha TaxID=45954 RepID=A0A9D4BRJ9_DREPO|nr:hypothetical protein DPMN_079942 [Dreissena polymorpha]
MLDGCKDYKRGTAMVFRKIFTEEETRGRSLKRRPAIEDQKKISFLEGTQTYLW